MWRLEAWQLLAAVGLDALLGDPRRCPHVARGAGWLSVCGERVVSRFFGRGVGAGALFWFLVSGCSFAIYFSAVALCQRAGWFWWQLLEIVVVYQTIAARDLARHVQAIIEPLQGGNLEAARDRLSWIVGRDTARLDRTGVSRAAIESVAESTSDGVIAPLFWALLAGAPGALLYRVVNTLDSMVGHRNERYESFGKVSARIDDFFNWVPSRLVGFCIGAGKAPWERLRSEAGQHASPNAGWPEAAMAYSLGIRLGGENSYDGIASLGPIFNLKGRPAGVIDIESSLRKMWKTTLLCTVLFAALLQTVSLIFFL